MTGLAIALTANANEKCTSLVVSRELNWWHNVYIALKSHLTTS